MRRFGISILGDDGGESLSLRGIRGLEICRDFVCNVHSQHHIQDYIIIIFSSLFEFMCDFDFTTTREF